MADWASLLRPTSKRILDALLPGERSLSALAEEVGLTKPSLLPHLKDLAALGWIERKEVRTPAGREIRYALVGGSLHLELRPKSGVAVAWGSKGFVDDDFPYASQVQDVALRAEIVLALRRIASPIHNAQEWANYAIVLFGSAARAEATWKSDLDLLVVAPDDGPSRKEAMLDAVAGLQPEVKHAIRLHFTTRRQFLEGRRRIEQEAAREGLVLWATGDGDLWRKMERYKGISI